MKEMKSVLLLVYWWIMSAALEEQYMIHSLTLIGRRYFASSRNTMIASSSKTNCPLHELDFEDALLKDLHLNEFLPTILSKPLVGTILKNEQNNMKIDNYIILACGVEEEDIDDLLEAIQILSYQTYWNPRARYIITASIKESNSSNSERIASMILKKLLRWKIINVTIMLIHYTKDEISVRNKFPLLVCEFYTWFPYQSPSTCLDVHNVTLIDKWVSKSDQGKFINNADLFPTKITNNLQGCPIVAATFPIDFMVVEEESNDNTLKYGGYEGYIINTIVEKLNLTLIYRPPPPNNEKWGGLLEDGTVTGLLGELLYNKADIGFAGWPQHQSILIALDSIDPYFLDSWKWWVPCAEKLPRLHGIFRMFSTYTWFIALFSIILAIVTIRYLDSTGSKFNKSRECHRYRHFGSCACAVWSVFLNISVTMLPQTNSVRTFFIFWLCYSFAMSTIFQTFLTTYLIEPGIGHQLRNLKEILVSGIGYGYNPLFDLLVNDSEDELKYEILKNRLACYEGNTPPCLDWVADYGNFTVLCSDFLLRYLLAQKYMDKQGKPLICQTEDTFFTLSYVIYMTKWNPLLNKFNSVVKRALESGLLMHRLNDALVLQRIHAHAIVSNSIANQYNDLSFIHLYGIIIVGLWGLGLSCFIFICELFMYLGKNIVLNKRIK